MSAQRWGWLAHLFTVLVRHNRTLRRTRISAEDYAVLEEASHDGCTGARCLWQRNALFAEKVVAGGDVSTLSDGAPMTAAHRI